jgi:hypothetical protein
MEEYRKIGMILRKRGDSYLPASRAFGSDEKIFEKANRLGADGVRILEGPKKRFYVRSGEGWEENLSLDPTPPNVRA